MGGIYSMYRGDEKCIENFDRKPEGIIQFGRPRRGWGCEAVSKSYRTESITK
jgi:hypothetical protein